MLQNSPMYSYIPAKEVARARKFYEEQLGFKPREVTDGGVVYEFAKGTSCFGRARTVSNEVEIKEARLSDKITLGSFEFKEPVNR